MSPQKLSVALVLSVVSAVSAATAEVQEREIIRAITPQDNARFGTSLVLSEDYLVVSSPDAFTDLLLEGRIDIRNPDGTGITTLSPNTPTMFGFFGRTIALEGDLLAASVRDITGVSRVEVFDLSTQSYVRDMTTPSLFIPGATEFLVRGLSMDNGVLAAYYFAVGDIGEARQGRVVLFDVATGTELTMLEPNTPGVVDCVALRNVLVDGDTLFVGADRIETGGDPRDGILIYDIPTMTLIGTILSENSDVDSSFGFSIAVEGDLLVVGSMGEDVSGEDSGVAYIYDWTTGQRILQLLPSDVVPGAGFGGPIAISNGQVLVGDSEVFYLFDAATGTEIAKLVPSDFGTSPSFGSSMGLVDDAVFVGAFSANSLEGAVYRFDLSGDCSGDANYDGTIDLTDLNALLGRFGEAVFPGSPGDFDGSETIDLPDLNALLSAFGTAC